MVDALLAMAVGDCIAPVEKRRNAPLAALISTKSFFFGSSGLGAATGSSGVFACTYWLNCIDACISYRLCVSCRLRDSCLWIAAFPSPIFRKSFRVIMPTTKE